MLQGIKSGSPAISEFPGKTFSITGPIGKNKFPSRQIAVKRLGACHKYLPHRCPGIAIFLLLANPK
jgi:hypothetical protein